jgi:hypothetical protein
VELVTMSRILDGVAAIPEKTRGPLEKIETWADVQRVLALAQRTQGGPRHKGHDYSEYSEVL